MALPLLWAPGVAGTRNVGTLVQRPNADAAVYGMPYWATDTLQLFQCVQLTQAPDTFGWVLQSSGTSGANLFGLLAARPVANAGNASQFYYATDIGEFFKNVQSAAATFTWVLFPGATTLQATWNAQAVWFLSATGLATNSGAVVGLPIPPSELTRRLTGQTITVAGLQTIHYDAAGDPTGTLKITWDVPVGCQVFVLGTATSTGVTGTCTKLTVGDPTINVSFGFEDTALPLANSFTAHVGQRIRITAGVRSGLCMTILKDENSNAVPIPKTARIAAPYLSASAYPINAPFATFSSPVFGDPYVIETLPVIKGIEADSWQDTDLTDGVFAGRIITRDIKITTNVNCAPKGIDGNNTLSFVDCDLGFTDPPGGALTYVIGGTAQIFFVEGAVTCLGVGFLRIGSNAVVVCDPGSNAIFYDCTFQGDPAKIGGFLLELDSNSTATLDTLGGTGNSFWDSGIGGISIFGGDAFAVAGIYGDCFLTTGKGVYCVDGGHLFWSVQPSILATPELYIDGASYAWSPASRYDGVTGSAVVPLTFSGFGPEQLCTWSADASLVNAAAQDLQRSGLVTQLAQAAGVLQPATRWVSDIDVAFIGNVANVAGQTATVAILRSADHGATFGALAGASSGAIATTAGAHFANIAFAPVLINAGDILRCPITPSALLTAVLTSVVVGLR